MTDDFLNEVISAARFDPDARSLLSFGETKAMAVEMKTLRRRLRVEIDHSAAKSAVIEEYRRFVAVCDDLHIPGLIYQVASEFNVSHADDAASSADADRYEAARKGLR